MPSSVLSHDDFVSPLSSSTIASNVASASSTLLFSIATAAATAAGASNSSSTMSSSSTSQSDPENNGECKLLGSFAIFVQGALGALALLTLVYKRWRERPQRPVKVWAFDASKQVVGSILLHLANLVMAMFSAGQIQENLAKTAASVTGIDTEDEYQPNPCSWYLLNLAIDTTLGIPILIAILKILTIGASYTPLARPPQSIESGNYDTPPKASWWMKQCLIYFIGLMGMKSCVFLIFQLCPWLGRVGDWALGWTEGNEAVQIAFVMFIFPLIMNGMQYYIIDIFIKKRESGEADANTGGTGNSEDEEEQGRLLAADSDHGQSLDEDEVCKSDGLSSQVKNPSHRVESYDPGKDGVKTPDSRGSGGERSDTIRNHAEEEAVEHRPRI